MTKTVTKALIALGIGAAAVLSGVAPAEARGFHGGVGVYHAGYGGAFRPNARWYGSGPRGLGWYFGTVWLGAALAADNAYPYPYPYAYSYPYYGPAYYGGYYGPRYYGGYGYRGGYVHGGYHGGWHHR